MKRRTFIENSILASAGVTFLPASLSSTNTKSSLPSYLKEHKAAWEQNPKNANEQWFRKAGLGVSFHYGLYSLLGQGEDAQFTQKIPFAEYQKLSNRFTAQQFDAEVLVNIAQAAGGRYIDFTCRHHDGFDLFQTQQSTFNIKNSAAKRDLLKELYNACEQRGMALFLSYSYAADWVHPNFPNREEGRNMARPDYGPSRPEYPYESPEASEKYTDFNHRQFVEILNQYPLIAGIRFHPLEGFYPKSELFPLAKSYSLIRSLSPHALISFEAGATGDEDFTLTSAEETLGPTSQKVAKKLRFKTSETEISLQPSGKGYFVADNGKHRTGKDIVQAIQNSQRLDQNLLLHVGLLPDGSVHPEDMTSLRQVGTLLGSFDSNWHKLSDGTWIGENYWANRLQDWQILNGGLECNIRGRNRSVVLLTHELGQQRASFFIKTDFRFLSKENPNDFIGFRLGSTGPVDDFRSAAVYGKGFQVGVRTDGKWVLGNKVLNSALPVELLFKTLSFDVIGEPTDNGKYTLHVRVKDGLRIVAETQGNVVDDTDLIGGIALISHCNTEGQQEFTPNARFENWHIDGPKLVSNAGHTYGPIYFAQYTLHNSTVKLSALCAPVVKTGEEVVLELKENGQWRPAGKSTIDTTSFIAAFKLTDWKATKAVPYRLTYALHDKDNQPIKYTYEGSIAPAPSPDQPIKLGLFSCNCDH